MVAPDDLHPPRRPLLVPVVIATVLLTVLGVGVGLILQPRHQGGGDEALPGPSAVESATWTPPGPPCRSQTQDAAAAAGVPGRLYRVLRLRTKTSSVFICEGQDGGLYYHANRGAEDGDWVEGETALFLPGVRRSGDTYTVVSPDGVKFTVSAERLVILHKDGTEEEQPAA